MANNNDVVNLEQVAPPLPPQPNVVGPIAVADPARNLVEERNAEAARDRQQAAQQRNRFTARRTSITSTPHGDEALETALFTTAMSFPLTKTIFPRISVFFPNATTLLYYMNKMDHVMTTTKRWTDNCTGWVPPISHLYISVLFYIQIFRAMEASGFTNPGSEISILLNDFKLHYPLSSLWIPGPLVQFFKNLSCFFPSSTEQYGNVTPIVPVRPGWTRARTYKFNDMAYRHLPNLAAIISRLRSTCAAAARLNTTADHFMSDIEGPYYVGRLFGHGLNHGVNEIAQMNSPGMKLAYSGSHRLWQEANAQLPHLGLPPTLDSANDVPGNHWSGALFLETDEAWFGNISAIMARYCQFWKASRTLEDCSPNNSAAGGVICTATQGSIFRDPLWYPRSGNRGSTQHGDPNQGGHYATISNASLTFDAETSIVDIPEAFVYAAITYQPNLVPTGIPPANVMNGPFWDIVPTQATKTNISVYQGITASFTRTYHCDQRIDAERQ